jgi:hypothetical protein
LSGWSAPLSRPGGAQWPSGACCPRAGARGYHQTPPRGCQTLLWPSPVANRRAPPAFHVDPDSFDSSGTLNTYGTEIPPFVVRDGNLAPASVYDQSKGESTIDGRMNNTANGPELQVGRLALILAN